MYRLLRRPERSVVGIVLLVFVAALSSVCANAQRMPHPTRKDEPAAKAKPAATQTYTETIVHQFAQISDGHEPVYGLASDSSGNLYGVTNQGGSANQGALFELSPDGNGSMAYNFLDSLGGDPTFITADDQGNLYIVLTSAGGGTLELSKGTNGSWFVSNDSGIYSTMVVPDGAGNVYEPGFFELQAADDQWLYQSLLSLPENNAILKDKNGDFYGTTLYDGLGYGSVIKLHNGENGWVETILHYFQAGASDGGSPTGPLTFGPKGNIYGTVQEGLLGWGGVYEVTNSGELTWLYAFTGAADGSIPSNGVVFDKQGNLYGTAQGGNFSGQYCGYPIGCGVVYKLTPPSGNQGGPWTESVPYTFSGGVDGFIPVGPLVLDDAGDVYGVTKAGGNGYGITGDGVIFELIPNAVPTSINITKSSPNPSLAGKTVRVKFTVAQTVAGLNPPSGTVTVTANTGESCFEPLPAGGKGSCQLQFATAGTRTLTASYSGDSGNLASVSSPVTQNTMSPTTTEITKNEPDPVKVGRPVTVHFSVEATNGTNKTRPTGSVSVSASTGESCTATLAENGQGRCKLTYSSAGSSKLIAAYSGDTDNEASVSTAVAETVD